MLYNKIWGIFLSHIFGSFLIWFYCPKHSYNIIFFPNFEWNWWTRQKRIRSMYPLTSFIQTTPVHPDISYFKKNVKWQKISGYLHNISLSIWMCSVLFRFTFVKMWVRCLQFIPIKELTMERGYLQKQLLMFCIILMLNYYL